MPGGMDGVELARRIRAQFPRTPVLLTTGFGHRASDMRESGIELVPKPYDPVEVMATMDRLIAEARSAAGEGKAAEALRT
jgi:DNA-binding response OmpR family regulator